MKIGIIIKREYLTRVRKRSFVIMTILTPILFAALMFLPTILMNNSEKFDKKRTIVVNDETGFFKGQFKNTDAHTFIFEDKDIESLKELVEQEVYDGILYIPSTSLNLPVNAKLYSKKALPITLSSYLENIMKQELQKQKLLASGIDPALVKAANVDINITSVRFDENNEEKNMYNILEMFLGLGFGLLIYMVIFMFGNQVMSGVIEEKTNRIVEVIVSSVKPFELMMGKIIGTALVGLTQFMIWIVLTLLIYSAGMLAITPHEMISTGMMNEQAVTTDSQQMIVKAMEMTNSINFKGILFCFLLYFIGGYMLYAALFAAIGSFVDNETDKQQFVLPVSLPLLFVMVCCTMIINNPDSSFATWLSIIPFTSPVAMMMRIPYGVPYWQISLSVALLVVTFVFITWVAAKIYRTGILMYGKKTTYKEIWKWLKY